MPLEQDIILKKVFLISNMKIVFKKTTRYGSFVLFLIVLTTITIHQFLGENQFRSIKGILVWFITYPSIFLGAILSIIGVSTYFKDKNKDKLDLYFNIPMLIVVLIFLFLIARVLLTNEL